MKLKLIMLVTLLVTFVFAATAQRTEQKTDRWEKLGERSVNFKSERDVIKCSNKGTFTRIKIRVDNAAVEFDRILLEYGNGEKQEIYVRQNIRAGGETREIDLRGNKRNIKKIT